MGVIEADPLEDLGRPQDAVAMGSSLDVLRAVYRDPRLPLTTRIRAAQAALPFEHPKLAIVGYVEGQGFAERLERAIARSRAAAAVAAPRPSTPAKNP